MERENFGLLSEGTLSRKDAAELARRICEEYRVPPVRIKYKNLGTWIGFSWSSGLIELSSTRNGRTAGTLLHELAHWILTCWTGETFEDHGPEFCAVHADILDTFRGVPKQGFYAACKKHRVRILKMKSKTWKMRAPLVRRARSLRPLIATRGRGGP